MKMLRKVPPFVTEHTFCASQVRKNCLLIQLHFCAVYDYVEESRP